MTNVGVAAVVLDDDGNVLCVRGNYGEKRWTLPGGRMEPGETPLLALVREVREESGYIIAPGVLVGVYSAPWKDDLVVCFTATHIGHETWIANGEISEIGFFDVNHLPQPFSSNARVRLSDAISGNHGMMRVFEPPR